MKVCIFQVSDLVEQIGWGRYHWKVVIGMGMMSFADAAEIWIISLISKDLVCEWGINSLQVSMEQLNSVVIKLFTYVRLYVTTLLTKRTAAQNEDALSYLRVRRLYYLAVVSVTTIIITKTFRRHSYRDWCSLLFL